MSTEFGSSFDGLVASVSDIHRDDAIEILPFSSIAQFGVAEGEFAGFLAEKAPDNTLGQLTHKVIVFTGDCFSSMRSSMPFVVVFPFFEETSFSCSFYFHSYKNLTFT